MPAIKIVSTETAAIAMGGFSYPHLGTNGRAAAGLSSENPRGGTYTRAERRSARRVAATIETARREGVKFWTATHSWGGRELLLDTELSGMSYIPDWACKTGWFVGYNPAQVKFAEYISASSGAKLRYVRTSADGGTLEYIAPADNPDYRGAYFAAWMEAEGETLMSLPEPAPVTTRRRSRPRRPILQQEEPLADWELELLEQATAE